jgi:hypothetical protein
MTNIKTVLGFIIGLTESLAISLEDGEISVGDVLNFWEPVKTLPDLVDAMDGLAAEASSLTPEQLAELVEWVKEEFDIPQDNIEATVEAFMDAGIKVMGAIVMFNKARQA